jgi:Mg/Co/Ni transporter MgtE
MMDEYFYDYGWLWEDNKDTAYRLREKNKHYRVFKNYKDGRTENVTDPMSRDEAIERLKQIHLLDPVGQVDWVEEWKQEQQDRKEIMNDYLRAKGRL